MSLYYVNEITDNRFTTDGFITLGLFTNCDWSKICDNDYYSNTILLSIIRIREDDSSEWFGRIVEYDSKKMHLDDCRIVSVYAARIINAIDDATAIYKFKHQLY